VTDGPGVADVTVVIAAHRAATTIDAALASIVAQTVRPESVIVVDDCSDDDTADAATAWADRLPLRVIRLDTNRGPAAARDTAIRATTTTLIALLDADDCWLPDHLESMLAAFDAGGGLVSADVLRWIPGRAVGRDSHADQLPLPPPGKQLQELYRRNFVFSGTLFRRADYLDVGGMRERFRGPEDWDLWIRLVRQGLVVSRPDHPTVLYRLARGSLSNRDVEQVDAELAVLAVAAEEATDDRERAAISRATRRATARRALFAAYDAAGAGESRRARRLALHGLVAGRRDTARRVVLRLLAVAVAPRTGAALRDAKRFEPRWWLSRS
jgi:glycosyltransferase involved in cell wall biosynthesis